MSDPRAKYSAALSPGFTALRLSITTIIGRAFFSAIRLSMIDVDVALHVPALLVLAPAVQQIQHRIFRLRAGVVVGRRVDVGAAPRRRSPSSRYHCWRTVPCGTSFSAVVVGVGRRLRHLDGAVVASPSRRTSALRDRRRRRRRSPGV